MDGFCRAIARLKAKSETNSLKETACSYLSSFRCETPFKILGDWRKTTELEFWTFWAVASKRSIGLENGFQIWNQHEILYQHGEFQVNRREKIFNIFRKTTELKFWSFWDIAPKRTIGLENGGQIWIQREILHLYGEFDSNRREKIFAHVPPRHRTSNFGSSGRILSCDSSFES